MRVTDDLPLAAIVGRPNVGKSTLFNHLTHSRRAIVGDEPGITRDRIYGIAEWQGRRIGMVDTGGILPEDPEAIPEAIFRQARTAIAEAGVILFVVDGRTELAAPDLQLARLLVRSGKPVLLLVNKMDSARMQQELGPFYRLGLKEVYPVSAEHGIGLDDVLEAVTAILPAPSVVASAAAVPDDAAVGGAEVATDKPEGINEESEAHAEAELDGESAKETRIAIVGRPNVGKSTLLNQLTGEERSIVSEIAGTTRDAVDAVVERGGRRYRLVDTAGIRRKGKTRLMAEKLSVVMARKHLERADVALIVLDGGEAEEGGVLALDATIAGYAHTAARSCVIVVNKWDLARASHRTQAEFEERVRDRMKFLAFAPVVFITARTGAGLDRLYTTIDRVAAARRQRVTTGELNRFVSTLDLDRAPVPAGQRLRLYYIAQVAVAPPRFVLFVDRARPLHFAFRRYLENSLRRAFGFEGTPIVLKTRVSGRGGRDQRG